MLEDNDTFLRRLAFNGHKAIFDSIKPGREGWIYLIHAQGTNRYKIGRSVNPISRHQVLQGQSPYPLKIIKTFWTVDMVADETYMHNQASEYRAYGEWFELEDKNEELCNSYSEVEVLFMLGYAMRAVAYMSLIYLFEKVGWEEEAHCGGLFHRFWSKTSYFYSQINSKGAFTQTEHFIRQELPYFIMSQTEDMEKEEALIVAKFLLMGSINGFSLAFGENIF